MTTVKILSNKLDCCIKARINDKIVNFLFFFFSILMGLGVFLSGETLLKAIWGIGGLIIALIFLTINVIDFIGMRK